MSSEDFDLQYHRVNLSAFNITSLYTSENVHLIFRYIVSVFVDNVIHYNTVYPFIYLTTYLVQHRRGREPIPAQIHCMSHRLTYKL